jgi:hypothetical protein
MTNDDKKRFLAAIGVLATVFPTKLAQDRIDAYFQFLKEFGIDEIEGGMKRLMATRKFQNFPAIGEIREAIIGGQEDIDAAGLRAWGAANKRLDRGQSGKSGDPILDGAIYMAFGGWHEFGQTQWDHEMADRAHFLKCYKAVASKSGLTPRQISSGVAAKGLPEGRPS